MNKSVFFLAGILLLNSCATTVTQQQTKPVMPAAQQQPEPFRNIYTQHQDTAPTNPRDMDFATIPDATPRREPRGKYGNKSPYIVNGKTWTVLDDARGYRAQGTASWYGEKFQGHRTSSFEPYDMYAMTAAHTTLPIPSYVRVTHLGNHRSVVVRINDRGPFHDGRIIDLSWAAAHKLGYAMQGTAPVMVEAIVPGHAGIESGTPSTTTDNRTLSPPVFYVQLGAFTHPDAAQRLGAQARNALRGKISPDDTADVVTVVAGEDALHRVRVGPWTDRPRAEQARDLLGSAGLGISTLLSLP